MVRTSIIVTLVLACLFTLGTLIFMIIAIVDKSSCESTESSQCPKYMCPSADGKEGYPATR